MNLLALKRNGIVLGTLALLALMGAGGYAVTAQVSDPPTATQKTITLKAGDVFEIMGVAEQDTTFSWLLLQGRTFVEAGKSRAFHIRLPQPGSYTLEGAADTPTTGDRQRLSVTLNVVAPSVGSGTGTVSPDALYTEPAARFGTIDLSSAFPVLILKPATSVQNDIHIDLDTMTDNDGDGSPDNDGDSDSTLFTREHNALYLWFSSGQNGKIRVFDSVGKTVDTLYTVTMTSRGGNVIQPSAPAPTGEITVTVWDNGQAGFRFPVELPAQDIVYHWDFGDGTQSLQNEPTHRYLRNGTYTVSALVRSLRDGTVVSRARKSVTVTNVASDLSSEGSSSSESISSAASSSSVPASPGEAIEQPVTRFGLILQLILIAAIAIVVGVAGTWILLRFVPRNNTINLQKKIEAAEAKLLAKNKKAVAGDAPPPLELRRPQGSSKNEKNNQEEDDDAQRKMEEDRRKQEQMRKKQEEMKRKMEEEKLRLEEEKREQAYVEQEKNFAPPSAESIDMAKAPPWLQKGITGQPSTGAPVTRATDIVAPQATSIIDVAKATPPTMEEVQKNMQSPAPTLPEEPLPDWLKNTPQNTQINQTQAASATPAQTAPPAQPEKIPEDIGTDEADTTKQFYSKAVSADSVANLLQTEPAPATPAAPTPSAPAPAPTQTQTTPEVPAPAPMSVPAPTVQEAPLQTPAPTPAPAVQAPTPAPQPQVAPEAPAAVATQVTPPPSPSSTPAAPTPADTEKERLEREYKRRKRQRYRMNKKKREMAKKAAAQSAAPSAAPVVQPAQTPVSIPAPAASAPTPTEQPAPVVPATPANPIEATPPAAPATPVATTTPAPEAAPAQKPEDQVAFVIRADSLNPTPPATDTPQQTPPSTPGGQVGA